MVEISKEEYSIESRREDNAHTRKVTFMICMTLLGLMGIIGISFGTQGVKNTAIGVGLVLSVVFIGSIVTGDLFRMMRD